ncbi:hypothetical protein BC833DRAFT_602662 [Globomyces pollinis-pini]|nr:hypothetical protein BC833DRAFT_602662 [Globomyces pollinis-pini]
MSTQEQLAGGLNAAAGSLSSAFSSFTASLKPLAGNAGKQWVQVQQFAKEKIGSSADVTELPAEYRQLEDRVDRLKIVHEQFLKVAKNYTTTAYDYNPGTVDKLSDFASSVSATTLSLADKLAGTTLQDGSKAGHAEVPPSLSHAFAKAGFQGSELVGIDEPLGSALKKFAMTEERIGNARVQQDQDAVRKFYTPFNESVESLIADAMKARRNVQSCRLTYDSCRARLKSAPAAKAEAVRAEMIESEDEFVAAVDEAMGKMKLVVENGKPLRNLADLVAIQLQYHKAAFEFLSELSPELDELVVTNEALYSQPQ